MPPVRTRAVQYRDLGDSIIELGVKPMAPCPQCKNAGVVCVVRKGYKKCGPCTRKNMTCGGNFSKAEFDKLSRKKAELREQSREAQSLMMALVQELVKTQKKVADAERRIAVLVKRQEGMADREADALGELDAPLEPIGEVAVMDDDPFCWADPLFEATVFSDPADPLLDGFVDIPGGILG